jgi:hypothetical protein
MRLILILALMLVPTVVDAKSGTKCRDSKTGKYVITPATAFEGKTARGNLGWWWLRVRGRHGP